MFALKAVRENASKLKCHGQIKYGNLLQNLECDISNFYTLVTTFEIPSI